MTSAINDRGLLVFIRWSIEARDQRRRRRPVERVAVALPGGQRLHRDQAAGAGPVQDQDLLAPELAQTVGDDARDHVGGRCRQRSP